MEIYNNPQISFVVPVFNVKNYLDQCLESIIKVNIDKEIILIDDGSTDGSREILKQYQQEYPYITLVCQSNKGVSAARNIGIKLAKGKYLHFVDPDDFLLTNDYQKLIKIAEKVNADILQGQCLWILPDDQRFSIHPPTLSRLFDIPKGALSIAIDGNGFLKAYMKQDHQVVWLGFFKTEIIKNNHILFEEDISAAEDAIFMLDIFSIKNLNVIEVFEPIYGYRFNTQSLSRKSEGNSRRIQDTFKAIDKLKIRYNHHLQENNNDILFALDKMMSNCCGYAYTNYERLSQENKIKFKTLFSPEIIERARKTAGKEVVL